MGCGASKGGNAVAVAKITATDTTSISPPGNAPARPAAAAAPSPAPAPVKPVVAPEPAASEPEAPADLPVATSSPQVAAPEPVAVAEAPIATDTSAAAASAPYVAGHGGAPAPAAAAPIPAKVDAAAMSGHSIVNAAWEAAMKTVSQDMATVQPVEPQRRGWKTIRIFVSSTFTDMHAEREALVKTAFPELRMWCEDRRLHLVECDLRWGVPKESTSEATLSICLTEVDRCREENDHPFFLNMLAQRYGWVPAKPDVPDHLAKKYQWVDGFSVTAMEIMHGAFREGNPNALFFLRGDGYTKDLPEANRPQFVDPDTDGRHEHLKEMKSRLKRRFGDHQVRDYDVSIDPVWLKNPEGKVQLNGLQAICDPAIEYFKKRIDLQYPLDTDPPDATESERLTHEAFLASRSKVVLGRDAILFQIREYIRSPSDGRPLVLLGHPGCGKSAVMAHAAAEIADNDDYNTLYHFVGAAPGSTDLVRVLLRIWRAVSPDGEEAPTDVDTLVRQVPSLLARTAEAQARKHWMKLRRAVLDFSAEQKFKNAVEDAVERQRVMKDRPNVALFIDALNQLDTDDDAHSLRWIPAKVSNNVRLVVSCIHDTEVHRALKAKEPAPTEIVVGPLDDETRGQIVTMTLAEYNKRLDETQLATMLAKEGSSNPLWLATACEELRVFGIFEQVDAYIASFSQDLLGLLRQVLLRLEGESDGPLIKATLCFIETSRHGLLEGEIMELLEDNMDNLLPTEEQLAATEIDPAKEGEETGNGSGRVGATDVGAGAGDDDNADDLKDKLHEDKHDAFRGQKDGKKGDKDGDGEQKKEKDVRKMKRRIAMALWVPIYRALGRFLRPCGGAGEGRLDFYHRAVSKAVRALFFKFDDEEYEGRHRAFWHGKLVTYFEDSNDMSRRAEELPYHLERILDNNKLARMLVEWPMFDRLNTEENKIDLLRYWRVAGGYAVAANLYSEALKLLPDEAEKDGSATLRRLAVAKFVGDCGQSEEAVALARSALTREQERTTDKTSAVLGECHLLLAAMIQLQILSHQRINFKTGDMIREGAAHSEIATKIFRDLGDEDRLCKSLLQQGRYYGSMGDHHRQRSMRDPQESDPEHWVYYSEQDTTEMANKCFDELAEHRKGRGALLEAEVLFARGGLAYNLDQYDKAIELLQKCMKLQISVLGEVHLAVAKTSLRIGRACEMGGARMEEAEAAYRSTYNTRVELLGPNHSETKMAASDLKDALTALGRDEASNLPNH